MSLAVYLPLAVLIDVSKTNQISLVSVPPPLTVDFQAKRLPDEMCQVIGNGGFLTTGKWSILEIARLLQLMRTRLSNRITLRDRQINLYCGILLCWRKLFIINKPFGWIFVKLSTYNRYWFVVYELLFMEENTPLKKPNYDLKDTNKDWIETLFKVMLFCFLRKRYWTLLHFVYSITFHWLNICFL